MLFMSFQLEFQEYDMSKSLNSTQFGETSKVFKFLNSLKTQTSRSQITQAPLKTLFQIYFVFFFPCKHFILFNYNFITFFLHLPDFLLVHILSVFKYIFQ